MMYTVYHGGVIYVVEIVYSIYCLHISSRSCTLGKYHSMTITHCKLRTHWYSGWLASRHRNTFSKWPFPFFCVSFFFGSIWALLSPSKDLTKTRHPNTCRGLALAFIYQNIAENFLTGKLGFRHWLTWRSRELRNEKKSWILRTSPKNFESKSSLRPHTSEHKMP
jgi:hypothetical protein